MNTLAHFWTLKAFLPQMIKEKTGHIVSAIVAYSNPSDSNGVIGQYLLCRRYGGHCSLE